MRFFMSFPLFGKESLLVSEYCFCSGDSCPSVVSSGDGTVVDTVAGTTVASGDGTVVDAVVGTTVASGDGTVVFFTGGKISAVPSSSAAAPTAKSSAKTISTHTYFLRDTFSLRNLLKK
jgi:hypothetical protein